MVQDTNSVHVYKYIYMCVYQIHDTSFNQMAPVVSKGTQRCILSSHATFHLGFMMRFLAFLDM